MNKIVSSQQTKIRVKEPIYLENIKDIFDKIDFKWSKFHRKPVAMCMLDKQKYCCASGILFIKATLSNITFLIKIFLFFFFKKIIVCFFIINYRSMG